MQDGLNPTQQRLLEKRSKTIPETEKWQNMYQICFPNDELIPSPYQDDSNLPCRPAHVNLADAYRQYLAREMPALVRRRFPEAMTSSDNAPLVDPNRLASIIRDLLNQLYDPFCVEMGIRTNSSNSSTIPDGIESNSIQRSAAGSTSTGTMASSGNDNPVMVNHDMGNFGESFNATDWIGYEFSKILENFGPDYQQAFPGEFEGHYGA